MRYRKLRIAWSVVLGVICLLLISLWVRSYDTDDTAVGCVSHIAIGIESKMSRVAFMVCAPRQNPGRWGSISSTHIRRRAPQFSWNAPFSSAVESIFTSVEPDWWAPEPWYEDNLGFAIVLDSPPWDMIVMPHWFLLLVAASLGGVPWIRCVRRFSLRTLLIATSLVAVVLAVYAARK
jgi:hypothetical protein